MMNQKLLKRMTGLLVLEILKNHTDGERGLQVNQIVDLLERDYGITAERKAVSRMLNDLYELTEISKTYSWKNPMPYTIQFDQTKRSTGEIRSNWRLNKPFEDVEVQLLMDAVQTVQDYPTGRIMEKLRHLGTFVVQKRRENPKTNSKMPYSMDAIARAIRQEKKLSFEHGGIHLVSPYRMELRAGVYYLVCYDEDRKVTSCYRVGDMSNATVLEKPARDYHTVRELSRWQYDLNAYLEWYLSHGE